MGLRKFVSRMAEEMVEILAPRGIQGRFSRQIFRGSPTGKDLAAPIRDRRLLTVRSDT